MSIFHQKNIAGFKGAQIFYGIFGSQRIASPAGTAVTDNAKLSLISYQQPFNSAVPAPTGVAMSQGDKQHLMWQYAGVEWTAVDVADIVAQARTISRLVFSRVFGRVN